VEYTYYEILEILNTPEWSEPNIEKLDWM
jgi:hypothetical protein